MEQVEVETDMSVELLNTLSLAAYITAGVLLLVAIALFFLLNVPKLIGDISGSTAKKAIEAIRQQNENTGDKAYKPSPVNAARGKLTDKISPSGKLERRTSGMSISAQTEKFDTTELLKAAQATTLLNIGNETTVLNQSESGATTLLSDQGTGDENEQKSSLPAEVTVDVEMSFTGSSEIIE